MTKTANKGQIVGHYDKGFGKKVGD